MKLKRNLTHREQLKISQQRGQAAVSLFGRAHEELEQANVELIKLVLDARAKVDELLKHIDDAEAEINMNISVQHQLSAFAR